MMLQGGTSEGYWENRGYLAWLEIKMGKSFRGRESCSNFQLNFNFGLHSLGRDFAIQHFDLANDPVRL